MTASTYLKTAVGLSLAGTLFAGYLSFYKYFTQTCAFNEPCPSFLGYPSCWYGLGMYLVTLVVSAVGLMGRLAEKSVARAVTAVSVLGILFAGYFTWIELSAWFAGAAPKYALVLPTCAYGLVFYLALFIASVARLRR
jgi:hypothetical protein